MAYELDAYRQEDFNRHLARLVQSMSEGVNPSLHPKGVLLGGQSGAGKTRLQKIVLAKNEEAFIVINGDEYRKLHPNFAKIQERFGIDAPAHTAAWSGAMVEALIDAFSLQGYNGHHRGHAAHECGSACHSNAPA